VGLTNLAILKLRGHQKIFAESKKDRRQIKIIDGKKKKKNQSEFLRERETALGGNHQSCKKNRVKPCRRRKEGGTTTRGGLAYNQKGSWFGHEKQNRQLKNWGNPFTKTNSAKIIPGKKKKRTLINWQ